MSSGKRRDFAEGLTEQVSGEKGAERHHKFHHISFLIPRFF